MKAHFLSALLARVAAIFIAIACVLHAGSARAILSIEITKGSDSGIPIAVVPFGWVGPGNPPEAIADIVGADLARSGRFLNLARKDFVSVPQDAKDVVFKDWRILKAEALVIGAVAPAGPGRYQVQFRLYDVFKEAQLAGFRYTVQGDTLRAVAHQIADIVYEKLTGEPGAFNTRIAYITKEGGKNPTYKLQVADSDGYAPRTVVNSKEPLLSPAWSPDGKRLAYVSFEDKRPKVYVQTVADGRRELIAEFKGINGAPAWSPDGKRLALALSKDGNAEIYLFQLATRELKRLTQDSAIDTEPAWSPDGRFIVFTSDRAGRPQIYRMRADGSGVERLTFEGEYNARPSYAPDGKTLTLVSAEGGRFHIAILRLEDGALQVLTDTPLDESPSFAPNGAMVIYSGSEGGRSMLATVSTDALTGQRLKSDQGQVREPVWGPFAQ